MLKNPNQPIHYAEDDVIRFKENKMVRKLLDVCTSKGYGLNELMFEFCPEEGDEDYKQLMQLIGYSVSGYGDLSCISEKGVRRADKIADRLYKEK